MSDRRSGPLFRLDLIIATLALLASASASIATVVQTRVVGNQLSAAVWPYLSFTSTTSPTSFVVTLDNDGLGPALVRNVSLVVDGKPHQRWRDALALFRATSKRAPKPQSKPARFDISFSEFGGGTVVRPATQFQILRLQSDAAPAIAAEAQRRVSMKICYCSILQTCWLVTFGSDQPPADVATCGPATPNLRY